jgi:hypothetical protein
MAKRNASASDSGEEKKGSGTDAAATVQSAEDRVIALAEQLGRIVGTMQAKAGALLDREALTQQISQVRDGATHLLEQLGVPAGSATKSDGGDSQPAAGSRPTSSRRADNRRQPQNTRPAAKGPGRSSATAGGSDEQASRPRNRGAVDAPGKKHRKPVPNQQVPAVAPDTTRLTKMKTLNANRRRGR